MHETSDSHTDIHWPSGFSPADAHSFHRAQAVVHGTPERAFAILTDVATWSAWNEDVAEVSAEALSPTFTVRWHGHRFEVFVGEHAPPRRLGWLGIGAGVQLYQAWLLTEVEEGTHLVVENVVRSSVPKPLDTMSATWVENLHDMWLKQVERLSEDTPDAGSPADM